MKGKSLFKKIGAIATTAAMLASVGTTAFAAGYVQLDADVLAEDYYIVDDGKTILMGKAVEGKDGIYEVKVPYTSTATNTIGVTMLAYTSTTDADLSVNDENTSYDEYDDETMQIVGVDQINVGTDNSTEFTFYVDTNDASQDDNTIKMEQGDRGIVLLSGDDATAPTGVLFQAGKKDATVEVYVNTALVTNAVTAPDYPTEGTGADYIEGLLTRDWMVKLDGEQVTEGINVTTTADYDASSWKKQEITYTVDVETDEYNVTESTLTVEYPTKAWTADNTVTYSTLFADPTAEKEAVTAMVKGELAGKTVALTNGTFTYNYALTEDEINGITAPAGDFTEGETYNYTLAIEGKTIEADEVTIPDVTVTIPVTIQVDPRKEAVSAKAFKGETEVTSGTYTMAEGDTAQKVLDYAKTLADSFKLYDEGAANEVAGTATWKLMKGEADATLTETLVDGAEYKAVATVVPAEAEDEDEWKDTAATVEITITVSAKPAFVYGEVDGEEGITMGDAISTMQIYMEKITPSDIQLLAADVDGEDGITMGDAISIMQRYMEKIESFPVEAK